MNLAPSLVHTLEHQGSSLRLLVSTELEVLASFERHLHLVLAYGALESEHDLLGRLGLLVEHRLGLTSVSRLLSVVSSLSLCEEGRLSGLVLSDLVGRVLSARLAFAVRATGLGNVDHLSTAVSSARSVDWRGGVARKMKYLEELEKQESVMFRKKLAMDSPSSAVSLLRQSSAHRQRSHRCGRAALRPNGVLVQQSTCSSLPAQSTPLRLVEPGYGSDSGFLPDAAPDPHRSKAGGTAPHATAQPAQHTPRTRLTLGTNEERQPTSGDLAP